MSKASLYYKNVSAEIIGQEHGISQSQFAELAERVKPAIAEVNKRREQGQTPYRDLPYNKDYPASVKEVASDIEGEFENFVVLGIGGSALGNIALQSALNPYMYNIELDSVEHQKYS